MIISRFLCHLTNYKTAVFCYTHFTFSYNLMFFSSANRKRCANNHISKSKNQGMYVEKFRAPMMMFFLQSSGKRNHDEDYQKEKHELINVGSSRCQKEHVLLEPGHFIRQFHWLVRPGF